MNSLKNDEFYYIEKVFAEKINIINQKFNNNNEKKINNKKFNCSLYKNNYYKNNNNYNKNKSFIIKKVKKRKKNICIR